jgi:hypothetical protein
VTVDLTATAGTAFSLADPLKVYSAAIVGCSGSRVVAAYPLEGWPPARSICG